MAIRGDSDFGGILRRCSTARSAWVAGSQWMRSRRQHQPDFSTALCCARQTKKHLRVWEGRDSFHPAEDAHAALSSLPAGSDSTALGGPRLLSSPHYSEIHGGWNVVQVNCTWPKPTPLPHLPLFSFPNRWVSCAPSSELALTLSSRRSTIGRQAGRPHHGYPRRASTCQGAYFRR